LDDRRRLDADRRRTQRELGERERFFRLLAENAQDVLYRFRFLPDRAYEYVSPSCTRITGYTPEDFYTDADLGLRITHPDDLHLIDQLFADDIPEDVVTMRIVRRDGAVLWTEQRRMVIHDELGRAVAVEGIARDITARRRAQERLETVVEMTRASLQQQPVDELLTLIARRARELASAAQAVVTEPAIEAGHVRIRVAEGHAADRLRGSVFPAEGTVAAGVMRSGRALRLDDFGAVLQSRTRKLFPEVGPLLSIPLSAGSSVFGVLSLTRARGALSFSDDDIAIVEAFAQQASMVLEQARLRDELQQLAVLRDRERIARDLHDGIIQALFGVGMVLHGAENDGDAKLIQARLGDAMTEIDRIIVDVRNYIYQLRPTLLDHATLLDALRRLTADVEQRYGVVSVVDCDPSTAALLQPIATDVLFMLREALGNVARHAHALSCRVRVRAGDEWVHIVVEDDGVGFDPAAVRHGQGLRNLADRVDALHGSLNVASAVRAGTTVEIALPVAGMAAVAEEVGAPA
jgi:PAS domain S-box-containing protein